MNMNFKTIVFQKFHSINGTFDIMSTINFFQYTISVKQ